ncbi:glypican-5 isoform D [Alligator mississippiensis]|uniref:Glypican-5 isoform D n=1 Tax=Alligator mississippiensis TaxID=8496 RepID=A0A151NS87_ALLMI|nr:glypican-5 isoform D [Alligator mississippiensis]
MGSKSLLSSILLFAVLMSGRGEHQRSCQDVLKVFQLRKIGAIKGFPETPRAGTDLQVCTSKNSTCCTKKMEERYQIAAKQDIQEVLQASSSALKFLISHNAAAFQETFEMLIKQAENYTRTFFCNTYRNMAVEAATSVQEFFTDVGLFVFGTDISTEEFVNRFFDTLFPVIYNHLINPGMTDISLEYSECIQMARREINPFANMAEIDLHWRGYIGSLEELSSAMYGTYDIEYVLLNFHSLINDALMQAHINGPKLSEQVTKVCGHPVRKPTQSPSCSLDQNKDNQGLNVFSRDSEETLASRRKDFINSLRLYRTFYGGLADQLCINELAAADGLPCWSGEDVVKSYTHRVVGNGIKAQSGNPEVKVKGTDPVTSQIIDKLKHIIQLNLADRWRTAGCMWTQAEQQRD